MTTVDVKLMYSRQALSSLAWDKARWRDGRRVILAPHQDDMAMQGPTCRVMPSERRGTYRRGEWVYTDPEPTEVAITMTWDEAAVMLMRPIAMFGLMVSGSRPDNLK